MCLKINVQYESLVRKNTIMEIHAEVWDQIFKSGNSGLTCYAF